MIPKVPRSDEEESEDDVEEEEERINEVYYTTRV